MLVSFPSLLLLLWQQKGNSACHGRGMPETELPSMYLPLRTLQLMSFLLRPNSLPSFPIPILSALCALMEGQIGKVLHVLR